MSEENKTDQSTILSGVMKEIEKSKREAVKSVVKAKVQELMKLKEAANNICSEIETELAKIGEKMTGLSSFLED